jgi:DNA polymerase-3 subunit beta
MKITVAAKPLAAALGLAASMVDAKTKIPALWHARLVAADDNLSITANVLDFALKLSVPATVEAAGEIAVSSAKLAALAGTFSSGDAEIMISTEKAPLASIACGRSRFILPTIPIADLPPVLEIKDETGRIELDRSELLAALSKPVFAISAEESRFYLNGIFVHDTDAGLALIATDGSRLARAVLPGAAGLSRDRRLLISRPTVKFLLRLLTDKTIETVTLRRSATLLEITGSSFDFVSKLIDAEYPAYERVLPSLTKNSVIVAGAELVRAIGRVWAVAPEAKTAPTVGLVWTRGEPVLRVVVPGWPDLADDLIAAEVSGAGRIAFQIRHGLELLEALKGDRVRIDSSTAPRSPILITDPDDSDFLVVQMPCSWYAEEAAA